MNTTNNIVSFYSRSQAKDAEKEKMLNALKFRMAVSVLERLRKDKEITPRELEKGQEMLARRFRQEAV